MPSGIEQTHIMLHRKPSIGRCRALHSEPANSEGKKVAHQMWVNNLKNTLKAVPGSHRALPGGPGGVPGGCPSAPPPTSMDGGPTTFPGGGKGLKYGFTVAQILVVQGGYARRSEEPFQYALLPRV